MTKHELISGVARRTGLTQAQVSAVLDDIGDAIQSALQSGGRVDMPGVGRLSVGTRSARVGMNPRTGERVSIPERRVVKFKASSALDRAIG